MEPARNWFTPVSSQCPSLQLFVRKVFFTFTSRILPINSAMPSWHSHSSTQSEPSCDQVFFWFQFVPHRSNQTLSPTQSYRDQCHQSRLAKDNAVTLKCHLLSCLPKIMCNSPKSHPNCPHFVSNPTCQHIHSQACFHKVQMPYIASKESIPFFTKYSHTKPPSKNHMNSHTNTQFLNCYICKTCKHQMRQHNLVINNSFASKFFQQANHQTCLSPHTNSIPASNPSPIRYCCVQDPSSPTQDFADAKQPLLYLPRSNS